MGRRWYYSHDGTQRFGPVSTFRLRELARSGALLPVSMVLLEGGRQWVKASTVKGLFPEKEAPPEPTAAASGVLTVCLMVTSLLLLGAIIAWVAYHTVGTSRPSAVAPAAPPSPAHAEPDPEPPDPELFENPPPDLRGLAKPEQERRQQKAEATYLDAAASDADHVAAANALLGLPRGHVSLLKGLDAYDRPGQRRRYRWCLQYLRVAQDKLDRVRPAGAGPAPGLLPAKHVAAMVEFLRRLDPKKPAERSQWATTLDYLEQHPEHARPVVSVLRELQQRTRDDPDLSGELEKAVAAAEKGGGR
jgi:hypothetical protein